MDVKTAQPLRDLAPGVAWNDAQRRSLAICIAGFFLPNLLAEFGVVPQLHQSFSFLAGCMRCSRGVLSSQGSCSWVLSSKTGSGCCVGWLYFYAAVSRDVVLASLDTFIRLSRVAATLWPYGCGGHRCIRFLDLVAREAVTGHN